MSAMQYFYIALAGAIGTLSRHVVVMMAKTCFPAAPIFTGTITVNLVGSLIIGVIYQMAIVHSSLSEPLRLYVMTGFLGGFTTFSAFSVETWILFQNGQSGLALAYLVGSPLFGVFTAFAGVLLARTVFP